MKPVLKLFSIQNHKNQYLFGGVLLEAAVAADLTFGSISFLLRCFRRFIIWRSGAQRTIRNSVETIFRFYIYVITIHACCRVRPHGMQTTAAELQIVEAQRTATKGNGRISSLEVRSAKRSAKCEVRSAKREVRRGVQATRTSPQLVASPSSTPAAAAHPPQEVAQATASATPLAQATIALGSLQSPPTRQTR